MNSLKKSNFKTRLLTILFINFFVLGNTSLAQIPQNVINQFNLNSTSSFFEIQKAMDSYWKLLNVKEGFVLEKGVQRKMPGWKLYKRWEYYWEQRVNQVTGQFPQTNSVIEYDKYRTSIGKLNKQTSYSGSWSNLGTSSSTGGYAGIGRINCVAFHPTDLNTFWVGSPSGGIWKTTNGGTSWNILNDNQLVLGVSDIIVPSDYATSNTLYIATGDRDGGSLWSLGGGQGADNVSVGVLKSTDGGATWNTTGLNYTKSAGKIIYSLLIHPTNSQILFASTTDGIYKTTDGGTTWVNKDPNAQWRLAFKPGDPTRMYGTFIGGASYFFTSTNSGETWSFTRFESVHQSGRVEPCVTPADPNVVYLLACNSNGGLYGVYKSTNSGSSFTRTDDGTKQMLGYNTDGSGATTGQGYYDLAIACSPTDANTIFIAGICTWKSTDGGTTWAAINNWTSNSANVAVVHADQHALAFQTNTVLFEGNDGGIYKTTNGGTSWVDLTNGMVTSQIYRIGVSQTNPSIIMNGLQDNGSKLFNTGTWSDVKGGDGMECIVDYSNSTYMYATYVQGQISRSTNGGVSFPTNISALIPGGQPTGAWVTPYIIDPSNSSTLYAGYDKIWKTTDRGNSWISTSQVLSSSDKLRSLAIAPSNSNVLYTADLTNLWKTTDGGTTNWSAITLPSTATSVTYITVKNDDPSTLWITYGGYAAGSKVYQSTNGGSTWTNISAGLPNLPVMSVVQYKKALDRVVLFAGTDVGVYIKDGSNDWVSFSNNLPNVVASEIEIYYGASTDKLRAGTFGRGLWETNIESLLPVELSSLNASFDNNSVVLKWITKTETNNYGFQIERSGITSGDQIFDNIGFVKGHGISNSPKEYSFIDSTSMVGSKYSYRLKQIDNDGSFYYSKIIEVQTGNVPGKFVLEQNYPNPFNPSTEIKYSLPSASFVQLKVYDILGKEVATLVNGNKQPGNYNVAFHAGIFPSGVYFYKLEAGSFISIKKMILMK